MAKGRKYQVKWRTITVMGDVPYVSLPELARMRGVSREAVWLAVKGGRLPHRRFGRRLYVPWVEAMAWRPKRRVP